MNGLRFVVTGLLVACALEVPGWAEERSSIKVVQIIPDRAVVRVGETITCRVIVLNDGTLDVDNVILSDNYGTSLPIGLLHPNDQVERSLTYEMTAALLPGPMHIRESAKGKDSKGYDVEANHYIDIPTAAVALTKEAIPTKAEPGTTITYTLTITNTGSTALHLIKISDDKLGDILLGGTLAAGASRKVTKAHVLPEDPSGKVVNTATVFAEATVGQTSVRVQDTARAQVAVRYPLELEKVVVPDQALPGQVVEFTITVRNVDDIARSFTLSDPLLDFNETVENLAAGGTWTKTFSYTVPNGAPNPLVNAAYLEWKRADGTLGKLVAEVRLRVIRLGSSPGDPDDPRNQAWDVSFAQVKVFDTQVLSGGECRLRILNGNYQPVSEIPISGTLYVEVADLDQNEQPSLRELVVGEWNRDSSSVDNSLGHSLSEHGYPMWPLSRTSTEDRLTPGAALLAATSISGATPTAKILIWNAQNGSWEKLSLRETAVGSGVFRSTTCIPVSGPASLNSSPGDTIFALYQDPSNHSDIAIATVKVAEGGSGGVSPESGATVAFHSDTYYPGAVLMITVTDPKYSSLQQIGGEGVLVLQDAQGGTIKSWDSISTVAGETARFRVTWTLPSNVALGAIRAIYTDPGDKGRTAQASAQVVAVGPEKVTGIAVTPNPFSTQTEFSLVAEPLGARASSIRISVYDLTGRRVGGVVGTNTASVSWDGGNLRNGAYIYVARVEASVPVVRVWEFKGFVYIKR